MSDVYEIAAKISLQDGASKIISALAREVPVLGQHFAKLGDSAERASARMKAAFVGIGSIMAGSAIFKVLDKFEEHGEDLVHVKTLFAAALPAAQRVADMAKVTAAAYRESAKNMQSTLTGNVSAMHDLYVVTQSIDHATKLLPAYNNLASAYASVKDQDAIGDKGSGANIASAIRAFELTGRNSEERLAKISELFVNTTIGLGEKAISGGQLLTQISNSGDARYGWSDEFLSRVLPAMIATGLQNRTGSAINAASNNLYGGVSSSLMQGRFQEKWGLHSSSDELIDSGKFKGFKVGSIWEGDKLRENQLEWANDYRKRLHDDFHVDINDAKKMQDIVGEIARGNKLLKADLDELLLPQTNAQLNKEVANLNRVSPDARDVLADNDPKAIRRALAAKWKDAMDGLGEQLVAPMMDNLIKPLTGVLRNISQFAGDHPGEIAAAGRGLLVLSAGLTALGTVVVGGAILSAIGAGGWLVVGFSSLAAAIALFRPQAFSEIVDGLKKLWTGLTTLNFGKVIDAWGDIFKAEIDLLPQKVAGAIKGAIDGIANLIKGALGQFFGSAPSPVIPHMQSYTGGGIGGGGLIKASYGGGGGSGGGASGADIIAAAGNGDGFNTRGVQNMNPGNIGYGPWARAHGAIGSAGTDTGHGVAVFPSFDAGYSAMGSLALVKYKGGRRSIDALIAGAGGWTPGNHEAAANIARMMGISPFSDAHLDNPAMMARFRDGLSVQELGPRGAAYAKRKNYMDPPIIARPTVIHTSVNLDGHAIAMSVTRHQTRMAYFPKAIGPHDSYGSYFPAGGTMVDA